MVGKCKAQDDLGDETIKGVFPPGADARAVGKF